MSRRNSVVRERWPANLNDHQERETRNGVTVIAAPFRLAESRRPRSIGPKRAAAWSVNPFAPRFRENLLPPRFVLTSSGLWRESESGRQWENNGSRVAGKNRPRPITSWAIPPNTPSNIGVFWSVLASIHARPRARPVAEVADLCPEVARFGHCQVADAHLSRGLLDPATRNDACYNTASIC
jgi:hypothetical protein